MISIYQVLRAYLQQSPTCTRTYFPMDISIPKSKVDLSAFATTYAFVIVGLTIYIYYIVGWLFATLSEKVFLSIYWGILGEIYCSYVHIQWFYRIEPYMIIIIGTLVFTKTSYNTIPLAFNNILYVVIYLVSIRYLAFYNPS